MFYGLSPECQDQNLVLTALSVPNPPDSGGGMQPCQTLTVLVRTRQLLLFFISLKPRVEGDTKSMSLKHEHASEPLHIAVK